MSKKNIGIVLSFILIVLILTFPAVFHLSDLMIGDKGDAYQFVGFQYIAKEMIAQGNFPFGWTNLWRYPHGFNFQTGTDGTITMLLGLFFYIFSDNPILVFNLTVLTLFFLNLVLSFISFRAFFNTKLAYIGAILYGASFYTLARLGGHTNLLLHAGLPFFLFAVIDIYKSKGTIKSYAVMCLACIVVSFSSLQYVLFLLGSLPFFAIIIGIYFRKEAQEFAIILWKTKLRIVVFALIFLGLFAVFYGQKLLAFVDNEVMMPGNHIVSPAIINSIIPNKYLSILPAAVAINSTFRWIEYSTFLGWGEIILFLIACFAVAKSKQKTIVLSLTVVFLILSLGKQEFWQVMWPYQYLFPHMPYRGITEASRFYTLYYFFFIYLILLFFKKLPFKLVVLIACVLFLQRLPYGFQLSPNLYDKEFISKVQAQKTNAVLDLPIYTNSGYGQMYDMFAVYYKKPIVNGYIHWSGDTDVMKKTVKELNNFECYRNNAPINNKIPPEELEKEIQKVTTIAKENSINVIVIHRDLMFLQLNCEKATQYIDHLRTKSSSWQKIFDNDQKEVWIRKD